VNKNFKARALFKGTNRKRTVIFTAKSEAEVVQLLLQSGYSEPFEITEELPESATSAQIEYARALQIEIPANPTKDDLSALIGKKKDNDSEPNPGLVEFAIEKGLSFSKYIGKKALYNLVFHSLSKEDRIAFFAFSVYRWLSEDRHGNLESHKYCDIFYDFAREQLTNEGFIKSLDKYAGADLRFFGTLKFADGNETYGGSTNTIAYKVCADFIHARFGTPKTKTATIGIHSVKNAPGKSGCIGVLLALAMLTCLLTSII
jgi:hypothetical protein